jgi:hypothetical protein
VAPHSRSGQLVVLLGESCLPVELLSALMTLVPRVPTSLGPSYEEIEAGDGIEIGDTRHPTHSPDGFLFETTRHLPCSLTNSLKQWTIHWAHPGWVVLPPRFIRSWPLLSLTHGINSFGSHRESCGTKRNNKLHAINPQRNG